MSKKNKTPQVENEPTTDDVMPAASGLLIEGGQTALNLCLVESITRASPTCVTVKFRSGNVQDIRGDDAARVWTAYLALLGISQGV